MADEVNPILPQPKTSLTIPLLLILSIFSLSISGYLFWQNQQLMKQLAAVPTPSPLLTTAPSPLGSPQPEEGDPTEGWKIYQSSTYEVKYPAGFTAGQNQGSILTISKWGPTQKPQTEGYDGIFLNFTPLEIGTDLETYVQAKIEEIKQQGVAELLSGPEDIIVSGYTGKTYTAQGLGVYRYLILSSMDGTMLMEIGDSTADPGNLGFSKTVDQILSTFKFL